MWRSKTMGFIFAAVFLTTVAPAYAQRWGREATPRSGVCFYEDINYGGRYFCSAVGVPAAELSSGYNDKISSIRLFGNAVVMVYRDPNFRGQSRMIDSSMSDLRSLGLNDRISSYQVESSRLDSRAVGRSSNVPFGDRAPVNATRMTYRDAERMVSRSYRTVLGRDPDPSGLRSWTEQVVNNNWTQRDLEYALRQSDEYRQLHQARRR